MASNNLEEDFGDNCEDNEKKWDVEGSVYKLRKKNRILELIVGLFIKDKEFLLKKELENSEGNVLQENKFSISILQKMSADILDNKEEKSFKCLCKLLKSIGDKVKCEDVDLKNVLDEMEQIIKAPRYNPTIKKERKVKKASQRQLPVGSVKLRWTTNPWKPARFLIGVPSETLSDEDKKTENLYGKVMHVLHNLTPKNFPILVNQVRELQIDTKERLQGVIDLIFDKAIDEPNFSLAYAKMCKELQVIQVPATNSDSDDKKWVAFRTLLVTRCQMEFEKQSVDETKRITMAKEINECSDAEKKKELSFQLEEYDSRLLMKSVGCVRFIGELFKQQMLTASIIRNCLQTLLDNKDEESLVCLCTLLTTVGEELESNGIDLTSNFDEIKHIVEGKGQEVSSNILFMLQNVIDLRDSKWLSNNQSNKKKPKSGKKSSQKGVELRWSTNPWKPASFIKSETLSDEEKKTEKLYKKVRSVLNKLTQQKFHTLVNQVKELQIDTRERLQSVVDQVVDKAIKEPVFSVLYAMVCKELQGMQVPAIDDNSDDKKGVSFRNLLVIRCQMEFEKPSVDETIRNPMVKEINECSDAEKLEELSFKLEEYDKQQRMKSVNFIRFIGELFKQQMFTAGIMRRCSRTLLDKKDEESLECLCKLLQTVGKELDFEGMDRCLQTLINKKDEKSLEYSCKLLTTVGKELDLDLTSIFDEMKKIVEGKRQKVCSRIRFMLQDVIDLKNSKWIPRRAATDLKTIDQIQKELNRNKLRKDVKGRRSREGGNQQKDNAVGWRSVGGDNRPAFTKQTEKIRAAKETTSMVSLVPPSPPPNTGPGNMQTTQLIPQAGQPLNNYQRTAPKQRRAIAIPIIDPNTGQIFDENNSNPASGESSPRQTPCPAPPNKEVQAAFAKQVAQAIMEDRQSSSSVATEQPLLHEPSPPEHFQPPSQSMPSIASSEPLDDISCTPS